MVATLKYLIENPSARPKGENGWGSDSDIYEHGNSGSQGGSSSKPSDTENHRGKEVVKIAKHDDHWHLYYADGTESVTYEDPTSVYPTFQLRIMIIRTGMGMVTREKAAASLHLQERHFLTMM